MIEPASLSALLEEHLAPITALQLLQNLGYTYLRPQEAHLERNGKLSQVLLEGILERQLRRLNRIWYKGREHEFSGANLRLAIESLKEAALAENAAEAGPRIHTLLLQGRTLVQRVEGDVKSFPLHYIDWSQPERNVFHIAEDFEVQSTTVAAGASPAIVLFVNGIPFVVIECGRSLQAAISLGQRNQRAAQIQQLFAFSHLLLATNREEARYAAPGSPPESWSQWREDGIEDDLVRLVNRPLSRGQKEILFAGRNYLRQFFDELEAEPRALTSQDRLLYSLCRPARLLELTRLFTVFIDERRQIARHQQFFAVQEALERSRVFDEQGRRAGGTIAEANGSGKYLGLLMLVRAILLAHEETNARVVVASDRADLDRRLRDALRASGKEPVRGTTGRHLIELLADSGPPLIVAAIEKFETAMRSTNFQNHSADLFVILDRGARGISVELREGLRKVLPLACCIEITGLPLKSADRSFAAAQGGFLDDYSIADARRDGVIAPVFYEARRLSTAPDARSLREWLDLATAGLSPAAAADLNKYFFTGKKLSLDEQRIRLIAWDIVNQIRKNLVAPQKAALLAASSFDAIRYKKWLDELAGPSAEALIPGPAALAPEGKSLRGAGEVFEGYWRPLLHRYGNEREYHRTLAAAFKNADAPEILIVVDPLPADFEGPRIQSIFLDRELDAYGLLQWAAWANAPAAGKDFGILIDYSGLSEISMARGADFDPRELEAALPELGTQAEEIERRRAELLSLFISGEAKRTPEKLERELDAPVRREQFSQRFFAFQSAIRIAFASRNFLTRTPAEVLHRCIQDLALFQKLRIRLRSHYAEAIDDPVYEPALQQFLCEHAGETDLRMPVLAGIFEKDRFESEINALKSAGEKADVIAHRIVAAIRQRIEDDPYFYRRNLNRVEDLIRDWRAGGLAAGEYLAKARELLQTVRDHAGDAAPDEISPEQVVNEFARLVKSVLTRKTPPPDKPDKMDSIAAAAGRELDRIFSQNCIVDWRANADLQNEIRNRIDAYLYSLESSEGLRLSYDEIDAILEPSLALAKARYAR